MKVASTRGNVPGESGVTLITACLRHEDPELTPEDVARALTIESFTEALEKVTKLMVAFNKTVEKRAGS